MLLSDMPVWVEYLAWISFGYLLMKFVLFQINFISIYFSGSSPDFGQFGSWSVVTGSTDGIGLAYAREFARRGQNIVLISRNAEKLTAIAEKIEKDFDVKTITIAADFSKANIYSNIKEQLQGLDIGVLVNNVGMGYSYPEFFVDLPNRSEFVDQMVAININSVVKMTDIVLPLMAAKQKGIILNISSGSANPPAPMISLYSATKQFVDGFSKCLAYEYKDKGVIIQCVMPYFVATKMSKIRKASLFAPTPETFVKSSLKTIGKTSRSYGYLFHAIQGVIYPCFPDSLYMWGAYRSMKNVRKRALKKLSEKKE